MTFCLGTYDPKNGLFGTCVQCVKDADCKGEDQYCNDKHYICEGEFSCTSLKFTFDFDNQLLQMERGALRIATVAIAMFVILLKRSVLIA